MNALRCWMCAVLAITGFAVSGVWAAKPPADIPLLVWFGNADGDGLRSDGQHATVVSGGVMRTADYADGTQNVLAILQGGFGNSRFDMQADTGKPSTRSVCVDFGSQLDAVTLRPLPLANQCVNIRAPMHAYPTGDVPIQNLVLGQQVNKLTRFAWDESGYRWRIGYGTDMNVDSALDSPPVVVTCIEAAAGGKPCTKWLMTPQATSLPSGQAVLFRVALLKGGKEGPPEFVADVVMPFSMTFSRQ